eukprot:9817929-Heterocapsa_arctica.AAC.1
MGATLRRSGGRPLHPAKFFSSFFSSTPAPHIVVIMRVTRPTTRRSRSHTHALYNLFQHRTSVLRYHVGVRTNLLVDLLCQKISVQCATQKGSGRLVFPACARRE